MKESDLERGRDGKFRLICSVLIKKWHSPYTYTIIGDVWYAPSFSSKSFLQGLKVRENLGRSRKELPNFQRNCRPYKCYFAVCAGDLKWICIVILSFVASGFDTSGYSYVGLRQLSVGFLFCFLLQVAVLLQCSPVLWQSTSVRNHTGFWENSATLCLYCYETATPGAG